MRNGNSEFLFRVNRCKADPRRTTKTSVSPTRNDDFQDLRSMSLASWLIFCFTGAEAVRVAKICGSSARKIKFGSCVFCGFVASFSQNGRFAYTKRTFLHNLFTWLKRLKIACVTSTHFVHILDCLRLCTLLQNGRFAYTKRTFLHNLLTSLKLLKIAFLHDVNAFCTRAKLAFWGAPWALSGPFRATRGQNASTINNLGLIS